jgi:hypothetical protein
MPIDRRRSSHCSARRRPLVRPGTPERPFEFGHALEIHPVNGGDQRWRQQHHGSDREAFDNLILLKIDHPSVASRQSLLESPQLERHATRGNRSGGAGSSVGSTTRSRVCAVSMEKNREFCGIRALDAIFEPNPLAHSKAYSKIPYATEQGIFW